MADSIYERYKQKVIDEIIEIIKEENLKDDTPWSEEDIKQVFLDVINMYSMDISRDEIINFLKENDNIIRKYISDFSYGKYLRDSDSVLTVLFNTLFRKMLRDDIENLVSRVSCEIII